MKILEKLFLKYEQSLNSISFIRSQNINCAMPRWEEKDVCHQKDITISIMFMKTTRNTCKNQKNSEEKCEKVSKHKLFSQKNISDALNAFSKTLRTTNIKMM